MPAATPPAPSLPRRYRDVSLWMDDLGDDPLRPRPPLDGDRDVDVAIIGAGYTGLWTAYYLAGADPSLRIAVVEAETAGFGGSGRNGGWCSADTPMSLERLAAAGGQDGAVAFVRALQATVDEVGDVVRREGIDCGYAKGGTLAFATQPSHVPRLHAILDEQRTWGFGEDDMRWLGATEVAESLRVPGTIGALYTPHCAAVQPARLVRGLAAAAERRGVTLYERCPATAVAPGAVVTRHGTVRAQVVVQATEAYTATFPGRSRDVAVVASYVVATAPLPPETWAAIGWDRRETFTDGRNSLIYGQRSADGRIVLGGRGSTAPYNARPGSRGDRNPRIYRRLVRTLRALFPAAADAEVTHHWGGVLALSRDLTTSVRYDRASGLAWAGGYLGDGVGASNLAGRTLAHLITGSGDEALARMPWVGLDWPRWEPEPFRWAGLTATMALPRFADAVEAVSGRPARRTLAALARARGR